MSSAPPSVAVHRLPSRSRAAALSAYCAFALSGLAGCSTPWPVEGYEAPGAGLAEHSTFFWEGGHLQIADAIDLATAQLAGSDIQKLIIEVLQAKGYREVASPEDAAMVVSYQAQVGPVTINLEKRIGAASSTALHWPGDVDASFASTAPRKWSTSRVDVAVLIDDQPTRHLLWHGAIVEDARVSSTPHAINRVVEMTGAIARRIPEHRS